MHEAAQQMLAVREAYLKDLAEYSARVQQLARTGKQ